MTNYCPYLYQQLDAVSTRLNFTGGRLSDGNIEIPTALRRLRFLKPCLAPQAGFALTHALWSQIEPYLSIIGALHNPRCFTVYM